MKYNSKYDVWVSKEGLIYRYDENNDKLILCKTSFSNGYERLSTKLGAKRVHRIVWETFNGEIPDGYEIDHIEGNRADNRLKMLRCVTHKENMANEVTRKRLGESMNGHEVSLQAREKLRNAHKGKHLTEEHIAKIKLASLNRSEEYRQKLSKAGKARKGETRSEFGHKFKEHYNMTRSDNLKLYNTEFAWFKRHKVCRWEVEQ